MNNIQSFLLFFYILDQCYDICKEDGLGVFLGMISPELWQDGKPMAVDILDDWKRISEPRTINNRNIIEKTCDFLCYYEKKSGFDLEKVKQLLKMLDTKIIIENALVKAHEMYLKCDYSECDLSGMLEIHRMHDECLQLDADSLRGQKFNNICLHRCILDDLDFHGSTLNDIDFRSAEMNRTRFASTVICNSKLIMVKARHAVFDTSTFCDSMILHSDFSGSSFKDADLSKNIIKNVLFANCDFRGANLSCKGFETCVLTGAIFDERTVWHEEFDAIEYGAIKV